MRLVLDSPEEAEEVLRDDECVLIHDLVWVGPGRFDRGRESRCQRSARTSQQPAVAFAPQITHHEPLCGGEAPRGLLQAESDAAQVVCRSWIIRDTIGGVYKLN